MKNDMNEYLIKAESRILSHLQTNHVSETIREASSYSIQAGGKRFRPYLLFASLESLGADLEKGVGAAAAVEMVHTYSLIHDDLPAMDDDDYRRGEPTNHKVFGEAAAILAGDTLLTESFNIITRDIRLSNDQKVEIIAELSEKAGQNGMIGGQMLDIEAEGKKITFNELEDIHHYKTGQLIVLPIKIACIIAGVNYSVMKPLLEFGDKLGILFQIRDDILDVEGNLETTGKETGSDARKNKMTYVRTYGLEGAKKELEKLTGEAETILHSLADEIDTFHLDRVLQRFAVRDK